MEFINGTAIANEIKHSLKERNQAEGIEPCLAKVLVGDDRDSLVYVGLKNKALEASGCRGEVIQLSAAVSLEELIKVIQKLNADSAIDGILVQLPLPGELDKCQEEVLAAIAPAKDVDGFNPANRGLLMGEHPGFISCAALACMDAAQRVAGRLDDKKVLLIGDSFDVIKPLTLMFIDKKCRVTVTPDFDKEILKAFDIIVIEKGSAQVLKGEYLKDGAIVLDCGFYWYHDRMCGNVDNDSTNSFKGYLLPVPGGMGPLLIAKLMENVGLAARKKNHE
jgi:methylenetetrahydrofolate dehydrogenase (NADP+)/methenyltetrahydrofolate cyclohydrolase